MFMKIVEMSHKKIESIKQLKEICTEETKDFFIRLSIGRSSKDIAFDHDLNRFVVFNNIDDTDQALTEAELYTKSNIGKAIDSGNFYKY